MESSKARLNSGDVAPGDRTAETNNLARFRLAAEGGPYKEKGGVEPAWSLRFWGFFVP
jgi:hypothetical protein